MLGNSSGLLYVFDFWAADAGQDMESDQSALYKVIKRSTSLALTSSSLLRAAMPFFSAHNISSTNCQLMTLLMAWQIHGVLVHRIQHNSAPRQFPLLHQNRYHPDNQQKTVPAYLKGFSVSKRPASSLILDAILRLPFTPTILRSDVPNCSISSSDLIMSYFLSCLI